MVLHFTPQRGLNSLTVPANTNEKTAMWMSTNVLYHPWNQLTLNGHAIPTKSIDFLYAVLMPPSGGTLSYHVELDPLYKISDRAGIIIFMSLIILYLMLYFSRKK